MGALDPSAYHPAELGIGLVAGFVALCAQLMVGRARPDAASRVAGLAPVVATLLLVARDRASIVIVVAVGIAASGSAIAPRTGNAALAGLAGAAASALVVPATMPWWARLLVPLAAAGAGCGLSIAAIGPRWVGPALTGLALVGIWASVPDTEAVLLVTGALAPTAASSIWPRARSSGLAPWSTAVLVTCVVGLASSGRPAGLPGALMCWGVILALPAVAVARQRGARLHWGALVLVQVLVVAVASRWAARTSIEAAGLARASILWCVTSVLTRLCAVASVSSSTNEQAHPPQ